MWLLKILGKTILFLSLGLFLIAAAYVAMMSGIYHTPDSFQSLSPTPLETRRVLVVGGTRGTGLEIVRVLQSQGVEVTALVRPTSNTAALDELGIRKAVGDAMKQDELAAIMNSAKFDAVISTLGTSSKDLPTRKNFISSLIEGQTKMDPNKRPDFIGNRNIIDTAKNAGVERMLLVTVIGPGKSWEGLPPMARRGHQEVIPLKEKAEDHLRLSGLDYTIIRPGGLSKGPTTGTARLTEDAESFSYMGRKDLAQLVVASLADDDTIGKTFTAYDPNRLNLWNLFLN
ncbi:MAG: SDR family oxidoreductase [Pseudomonadales bacterium]